MQLSVQQVYRSPKLKVEIAAVEQAVLATLYTIHYKHRVEITVRMVGRDESHALNLAYRGQYKPTNVLSFAAEVSPMMVEQLGYEPLGDLVICVPVVVDEAVAQHKSPQAHLTHLIVHGVLHLLGYDHVHSDAEAALMEGLEIGTLARLGFYNPYV